MIERLTRIGYWGDPDAPDLPDPRRFVDVAWDSIERETIVDYLRRGTVARAYLGTSICRLCGQQTGSLELSDGVFVWPEGLSHYVAAHGIRLPEQFVKHVLLRTEQLEKASIDDDWWKSQTPGAS